MSRLAEQLVLTPMDGDHAVPIATDFSDWENLGENGLPVLDLNSDEPLPFDLSDLAQRPASPAARQPVAPAVPAGSAPKVPDRFESADGSLWLEGEVLMCACPDCGAPMSIRIWLMVADCWKCTTNIELSEEQEREAQKLLKRREEAIKKAKAAPTPKEKPKPAPTPTPTPIKKESPKPPPRTPKPRPKKEEPPKKKRVAASKKHIGVRAKIRKMAVLGGTQVFLRDFFKDMPAWLISMLVHLLVITLLAMWPVGKKKEPSYITISTAMAPVPKEGDLKNVVEIEKTQFELPVPENDLPNGDPAKAEALLRDNQAAKELRIDPNAFLPELPDVEKVKAAIQSGDADTRMIAARDPRVRAEIVREEGGTTRTEAAVSRCLHWMNTQQNEDGGWAWRGGRNSDMAGTSLALLPYLGAGMTHKIGMHKDNVAQGLRWMIENQGADGDLRGGKGQHGMYVHGQATIVLCEAFKLTGDEALRIPAQKAVDFIVKAQNPEDGGWRYYPYWERKDRSDLSVVGWQVMALRSAQVANLTVPEDTLKNASRYLDSVSKGAKIGDKQYSDGAVYRYQASGRTPTAAMTAEGLLCRMYLGWTLKANPELTEGVEYLLNTHPPSSREENMYYWYYGTQVMHHVGGPAWEQWNIKMRDLLCDSQVTHGKDAGTWEPKHSHDRSGGKLYMGSLGACTLEVYYRHAPIFRQLKME